MAITPEQEKRFLRYMIALEEESHLWCQHSDKMRELLIILESRAPPVITLRERMAVQLRSCVSW
jgi:hypothetical protein